MLGAHDAPRMRPLPTTFAGRGPRDPLPLRYPLSILVILSISRYDLLKVTILLNVLCLLLLFERPDPAVVPAALADALA